MGRSMAGVRGSLVDHGAYKLSLPMGWTMDRSMGYPSNVDLSVITDTLVCFIRVFFFFSPGGGCSWRVLSTVVVTAVRWVMFVVLPPAAEGVDNTRAIPQAGYIPALSDVDASGHVPGGL